MRRQRKARTGLRRGFTLVEVMVVMTVVAASQGNYSGAIDMARQTKCAGNLRSAWTSIQMYEMTNGKLPRAAFYPKDPRKDKDSIIVLVRGIGPALVCDCMPDDIQARGLTFLWNDALSGKRMDQIKDPSHTWMLMEMSVVANKPPHRGGYNVLYADGQVRWTKEIPADIAKAVEAAEKKKKEEAARKK